MKLKIFMILLAIAVGFAWSADQVHAHEVGVLFKSNHFSDTPYNEDNPGFYVSYNTYTVGAFKNSYYDTAYIFGKTKKINEYFSVGYGAVYGYAWDAGYIKGKEILPYILPTFSFDLNGIKINTHYIGMGLAWSISKEF